MSSVNPRPSDNFDPPPSPPPPPRPQPETLLYRALRLRCPRCGKGKLYAHWFRMNPRCPECHFLIERPSGYYIGSTYFNYGITAIIITATFVIGRMGFGVTGKTLLWPLGAFSIVFPTLVFRHARAVWLAMDCFFDSSVLSGEDDLYAGSED